MYKITSSILTCFLMIALLISCEKKPETITIPLGPALLGDYYFNNHHYTTTGEIIKTVGKEIGRTNEDNPVYEISNEDPDHKIAIKSRKAVDEYAVFVRVEE